MHAYQYDYLLTPHFEKQAFIFPLLRAGGSLLARGAGLLGRGALGVAKPVASAAWGAAKPLARGALQIAEPEAANLVQRLLNSVGSVSAVAIPTAFSIPNAYTAPKLSSLREKQASYTFKSASQHGLGEQLLSYAPYLAWMGSHAIEEKHPTLARAISAGAALTAAGKVGRDIIHSPEGRGPNAVDLAALLAIAGAEGARLHKLRKGPAVTA